MYFWVMGVSHVLLMGWNFWKQVVLSVWKDPFPITFCVKQYTGTQYSTCFDSHSINLCGVRKVLRLYLQGTGPFFKSIHGQGWMKSEGSQASWSRVLSKAQWDHWRKVFHRCSRLIGMQGERQISRRLEWIETCIRARECCLWLGTFLGGSPSTTPAFIQFSFISSCLSHSFSLSDRCGMIWPMSWRRQTSRLQTLRVSLMIPVWMWRNWR